MLPDRIFSTQPISILKTDISVTIDRIIFPVHNFIWRFEILIVSLFALFILEFGYSGIESQWIVNVVH